jgi:hypothetical protein
MFKSIFVFVAVVLFLATVVAPFYEAQACPENSAAMSSSQPSHQIKQQLNNEQPPSLDQK